MTGPDWLITVPPVVLVTISFLMSTVIFALFIFLEILRSYRS